MCEGDNPGIDNIESRLRDAEVRQMNEEHRKMMRRWRRFEEEHR